MFGIPQYRSPATTFQQANNFNGSKKPGSFVTQQPLRFFNYWCETCDRGFKTSQILENHISEHQICGIDGCKFIAHPKVVTKHIEMQHSTGLFTRIKNLETPEDIANWIKERKKNYPSKKNIEKENAAKKECAERGEKLKDPKSKFNNRRDRSSNFRRNKDKFNKIKNIYKQEGNVRCNGKFSINNKKDSANSNNKFENSDVLLEKVNLKKFHKKEYSVQNKKFNSNDIEKSLAQCVIISDPIDEEYYCGIQAFKGTSYLESYNEFPDEIFNYKNEIDIEDDEWDEKPTTSSSSSSNKKSSVSCKALDKLISAYQSSSEEEDKKFNIENVKKLNEKQNVTTIEFLNIEKMKCSTEKLSDENNDGNNSGPESAPIERSYSSYKLEVGNGTKKQNIFHTDKQNSKGKRKHSRDNSTNNVPLAPKRPLNAFQKQLQYYKERPSTLLEKLLEKDIRHERNVILQCVDYIVKNDFFNISQL